MEINYNPISEKKFKQLAEVESEHCVSMYIPTYKGGKEQNLHLSQGYLNSCIKQAENELLEYQISNLDIKTYLKPISDLLSNVEFWRTPSEGSVLFLNNKGLETYKIPIPVKSQTYVANHFYVKPLVSLFTDDHKFFLLELSQDYVKLYEASRYYCKEMFIDELAPEKLQDTVGYDYRPKMLQFRTGQATPAGVGSFHGHGEGKDEDKLEIEKYFRAINNGILKLLHKKKEPLVVSCVDYLFPIYKEVNKYPFLLKENISGDPEFEDKKQLHSKSWNLIHKYFTEKDKDVDLYNELYNTQKTSYELEVIIPAAIRGKVDTLFIQNGEDIFGTYNKENDKVTKAQTKKLSNTSLQNLATVETIRQGGKVYLLDAEEMPIENYPFNAIFRY